MTEFLVIVGASRDGRKTVHAAEFLRQILTEKGEKVEFFDLKKKQIPFLNSRTYTDPGEAPENAQLLSEKVKEADCVVIVTPEYNHSIPGVLKNAIDHLYPEYDDKPFAYVTTSAGGFGGVRGLSHLHDITIAIGGHPGPSLNVSRIGEVFGEEGELKDEDYRERFKDFVDKMKEHAEKMD
ncbi:MAG: NADPH-dependent FMN reductase [Candidatus Nanohaloarchaea archaeon]